MANIKITGYAELAATPADDDILEIVDDVAGTPTSKKISVANLHGGVIKAGATITDNRLVRGDGGSRGVQETTIIVSDNGEMTNSSQPAFSVRITNDVLNMTGDGTQYNLTGAIWTEIFDQNGDIVNGTFTAPVTGKYFFGGTLQLLQVDAAHTRILCALVTSNRTIVLFEISGVAASPNIFRQSFGILTDLDAADTAYLYITVFNSTKTIDLDNETFFQGALIC